eukprot:GHRR01005635.1.p1 GENE.GHRR01005635.1~~GHRR01005635.1.p1  ORF type:complete len:419 (+),score=108.30 GHRR01005635.1:1334-2590(+)
MENMQYIKLPGNEPGVHALPIIPGRMPRHASPAAQRDERRSRSAQQQRQGANAQPRNVKLSAMLPTQKPVQLRQKDKLVLLPRSTSNSESAAADAAQTAAAPISDVLEPVPPANSLFVDLATQVPDSRGRITVYCIAESLKRSELEAFIAAKYPAAVLNSYSEVLHILLPAAQVSAGSAASDPADCFCFDYGVVCCWGLSAKQEQEFLNSVAKKAQQEPLPPQEVEMDQFEYRYSTAAPPSMQNDTITISRHHANDHQVKIAICHALAQSTKLSLYEERVVELVLETKHLPQALATHGTVKVSSQEVAQRIGQVFLQRSAVNLLSTVLDTPEFFWSAPDSLQNIYKRACDYLELETRVEVLNARFLVLQEMLDMLRDHQNNYHNVRLEWIIIWLVAVELVVGVFELMGLFGLIGRSSQ